MKAWEWCAWGALWLIAFAWKAAAVLAACMLGVMLGAVIYLSWQQGTLWVVPVGVIALGATIGGVIGAIELYDHLDRKRELRH